MRVRGNLRPAEPPPDCGIWASTSMRISRTDPTFPGRPPGPFAVADLPCIPFNAMLRPTLTLVIPIFNEEEVIPELARRLREVIQSWQTLIESWEVVFVNDGSRDKSFDQLKSLAAGEPRFKVISFARNFGHQMAITA